MPPSSLKGGHSQVSMVAPDIPFRGVIFQQGSEALREREEDGYISPENQWLEDAFPILKLSF